MYNLPPLAVVGAHIETVICHLSFVIRSNFFR